MAVIEGEEQEREGEGMLTFRHTHIPELPSHLLSSNQARTLAVDLKSIVESAYEVLRERERGEEREGGESWAEGHSITSSVVQAQLRHPST